MQSTEIIQPLEKPTFSNLPYIKSSTKVCTNLFNITFDRTITLYQYPYHIDPEISNDDMRIRQNIFNHLLKQLRPLYHECFHSGDVIYSFEQINDVQHFNVTFKGKTQEYHVTLQPCSQEVKINPNLLGQNDDQLVKQCIELILRDILDANPNLDFEKNLIVDRTQKRTIEDDGKTTSVDCYRGFTTSFVQTSKRYFLNVTLKNIITPTSTILQTINEMRRHHKTNTDIRNELKGKSFNVRYSKKNYIIDDLSFDRTPKNTSFLREGHNITLINYYKTAHNIIIEDRNQPLIIVRKNGPQGQESVLYFIPELCYLCGLDDDAIKNGQFMRKFAEYTKLDPNTRIDETNKFLRLLESEQQKVIKVGNGIITHIPSSKEKKTQYGIQISPSELQFDAYYMEEPKFINQNFNLRNNVFEVEQNINMSKWLCLYNRRNYNDADKLYKTLSKASKGFGIEIAEPEWIEMETNHPNDWTSIVDDYFNKTEYQFVLFLLDKNEKLYKPLKKHSLVTKGYHSQVVKVGSLRKNKNIMSVCNKILLQLNAKLGGVAYNIDFGSQIVQQHLMLVGVDSSHIQGKRTGVAMVASISDDFNTFYNKEQIIEEKNKRQLQFSVSKFIDKAVQKYYKKNKRLPGGIVIYRQGVSLQQKEFLTNEAQAVHDLLSGNKPQSTVYGKSIPYYYILVNTKTKLKFFVKHGNKYTNPGPGLLVYGGVTNKDFFEFYIQPQNVTEGSATPTCYHVAYGTMKDSLLLMKFTYDLCHIYANWQGAVRVPHVLKSAEKLSKMTAEYTEGELHSNLELGKAYL